MSNASSHANESASPPLTFERLKEMYERIPKPIYPAQFEIRRMPHPMITVPVRRHPRKKRRLQKKWLTRYGTKTILDPSANLMQMFVDKEQGVIYCYPEGERALKAAIETENRKAVGNKAVGNMQRSIDSEIFGLRRRVL